MRIGRHRGLRSVAIRRGPPVGAAVVQLCPGDLIEVRCISTHHVDIRVDTPGRRPTSDGDLLAVR